MAHKKSTQANIDTVLQAADGIIRAHVKKLGPLAGLAVGIVHHGELVYTYNSGFADIKQGTSVTADTVFRIMSISKTFTAVALMQLWEQGKFQLDDPVNQHLKAIRVEHPDLNAPPITIRHLLTHTSGIGELRKVEPHWLLRPELIVMEDLSVREFRQVQPMPTYYAGKLSAEIYPGVKWCYCNHAFGVLGQLVTDLSGQPFEQYVIEHIFQPLGMTQSDLFLSDIVHDRLATGYLFEKNGFRTVEDKIGYQHVVTAGASNIYSSVNDMLHYVAALMNGGANQTGRILQPETLAMMFEPHFQLDPRLLGQGLAFFLRDLGGHRTVGHGGGWPGFISQMLVAPDDGLALLVFTNTSNSAPGQIATDLMRRLLDRPDPIAALPHSIIAEQPQLWADICGHYAPTAGFNTNFRHWSGMGAMLEIFVDGNHLAARSPDGLLKTPVQLHPAASDDALFFGAVIQDNLQKIVFKRNAAGYIDRIQMGMMDFHKQTSTAHQPLIQAVQEIQVQVRQQRARLVFWYMQGMPNKLQVLGRVVLALVALRLLWRKWSTPP